MPTQVPLVSETDVQPGGGGGSLPLQLSLHNEVLYFSPIRHRLQVCPMSPGWKEGQKAPLGVEQPGSAQG